MYIRDKTGFVAPPNAYYYVCYEFYPAQKKLVFRKGFDSREEAQAWCTTNNAYSDHGPAFTKGFMKLKHARTLMNGVTQ